MRYSGYTIPTLRFIALYLSINFLIITLKLIIVRIGIYFCYEVVSKE